MSWKTKTLGELCTLSIGRTPSRSNIRFWDPTRATHNVWLSIADITRCKNRTISDSKEYLSDAGSKGFKKVKKGTLLLSFKLTIGKLAVAGTDLQTNEAIAAFNDLNLSEIDRDYLYYYLLALDWDVLTEGRFKVKGNTLNKKILTALPIRYPLLERQKEIVQRLDKLFVEIDSIEENLESQMINTGLLRKSLLDKALTEVSG